MCAGVAASRCSNRLSTWAMLWWLLCLPVTPNAALEWGATSAAALLLRVGTV